MFGLPKLSTIVLTSVGIYLATSLWTFYQLFSQPPPPCQSGICIPPWLHRKPKLELRLYTTTRSPSHPTRIPHYFSELEIVHKMDNFSVFEAFQHKIKIAIPQKVRSKNGTLYCHVFVVPFNESPVSNSWVVHRVFSLTKYKIPEAEAINLLGSTPSPESPHSTAKKKPSKLSWLDEKPVPHLKPRLNLEIVSDLDVLDRYALPAELVHADLLHVGPENEYLPILMVNELTTTDKSLLRVKKELREMEINLEYQPVTFGPRLLTEAFHRSSYSCIYWTITLAY